VLFLGTAVYNGSLKLPFLSYEDEYAAVAEDVEASLSAGMRTPDILATSALMRSPLLRRVSHEYESPSGALTLAVRAAARREANAVSESGGAGKPRALSSKSQGLARVASSKAGGDLEYGTCV
jgi:hypothetical protein